MVFSSSSDSQGLVEDIDFICETNSASYPTADKTRNINRWYYNTVVDILKSAGRVQFDDTNKTTLPYSTFDLVNGQADYSNPTDLLKLQAIEVKDAVGNWTRLKEIDFQSQLRQTISDFEKTSGLPRFYDPGEGSYTLYPAPATGSVTTTAGGKIYYSREVAVFTASDTTKEPGFAEPFHRILSLGASYDWCCIHNREKALQLDGEIEKMKAAMREFYGDHNRDVKTGLRPAHKSIYYR